MNHETEVKQEAPELPEWIECQSMFADGSQTPLTEFIRAYEPVGPEAEQWRADFADLLATARREEREAAARIAESHSATDCDGPDCGIVIAKDIRASATGKGEMNG